MTAALNLSNSALQTVDVALKSVTFCPQKSMPTAHPESNCFDVDESSPGGVVEVTMTAALNLLHSTVKPLVLGSKLLHCALKTVAFCPKTEH